MNLPMSKAELSDLAGADFDNCCSGDLKETVRCLRMAGMPLALIKSLYVVAFQRGGIASCEVAIERVRQMKLEAN